MARSVLAGQDVTRQSVQDRARSGVARTFQTPKLVLSLSVLDNAMLGGWPERAVRLPGDGLRRASLPARGSRNPARAADMLQGVGLGAVMDRRADLLEHTAQRFLEIARALTHAAEIRPAG